MPKQIEIRCQFKFKKPDFCSTSMQLTLIDSKFTIIQI